MNSADEVLLNNLTVNIPHLYSLFSCDCCPEADRYFIFFEGVHPVVCGQLFFILVPWLHNI